MAKEMSVFDKHQLAIAKKTLRMHDIAVSIMGGMTKDEARAFLSRKGYSAAQIAKLES